MKSIRGPSNFSYFELLDACKEPGCPICRLGQRSAQRHLTSLIYDGVNDVPLRSTLRESYGYCHEHAWLLPDSGESAPLGIAIVHRDILNTLRKQLDEETYSMKRSASLRAQLRDTLRSERFGADPDASRHLRQGVPCPACVQRDEAQHLAFLSLLEALEKNDEAMRTALEMSDGLCIAHLRQALNGARSQRSFAALADISIGQLDALIQDLDEFIRKSDHRFRNERISIQEGGSWRRALQRVSGKQAD